MPAMLTADDLRSIALTTFIVGGFAAGWGISGSLALPGSTGGIVLIVVLAITAGLFFLAFQFVQAARGRLSAGGQGANPFRTRDYQLAVLAEIVAILLAGRLLTTAGRPDAIMPAVVAIVGLHFFGLIRAFQSWRFTVVGAAMVLLAVLSFAFPPSVAVGPGDTPFRFAPRLWAWAARCVCGAESPQSSWGHGSGWVGRHNQCRLWECQPLIHEPKLIKPKSSLQSYTG